MSKTELIKEGKKAGKKIEDLFASLFSNAKRSKIEDDIYEHWDLSIEYKVDVKAMKRIHRGGDLNENIHWIELYGITGKPGWIAGKADFFAFETEDYFIVVDKLKLQEFIKTLDLKDSNGFKITDKKELYKPYRRKDRKDLMVLVKTLDLCYISSFIIKKNHL